MTKRGQTYHEHLALCASITAIEISINKKNEVKHHHKRCVKITEFHACHFFNMVQTHEFLLNNSQNICAYFFFVSWLLFSLPISSVVHLFFDLFSIYCLWNIRNTHTNSRFVFIFPFHSFIHTFIHSSLWSMTDMNGNVQYNGDVGVLFKWIE